MQAEDMGPGTSTALTGRINERLRPASRMFGFFARSLFGGGSVDQRAEEFGSITASSRASLLCDLA
jgi:hypothetical protein